MTAPPADRVTRKWSDEGSGPSYARERFGGPRAAGRDGRIVARALRRYGLTRDVHSVLDVPCGTGRLRSAFAPSIDYVGVDVSRSMLLANADARRAEADVRRLPFTDDSFDLVLCCRLLHHLQTHEQREEVVRETLRVARKAVLLSFWDSNCLPQWRARLGLRRARSETRVGVPRETIAELLRSNGAVVEGFVHSLRFVSQQTFVVARP